MTEDHYRGEPLTRAEYERVKGAIAKALSLYVHAFPAEYEGKEKFDKVRLYVQDLYRVKEEHVPAIGKEGERVKYWEKIIAKFLKPHVSSIDISTRDICTSVKERARNPVIARYEVDGSTISISAFNGEPEDSENPAEGKTKYVSRQVVTFFFGKYEVELMPVVNPSFAAFFDSYDGLLGSLLYRVCMGKGLTLNREGLFVQYEIPPTILRVKAVERKLFPVTRSHRSARNYLLGGDRAIATEADLIAWVRASKIFNVRGFYYCNPALLETPAARECAERLGNELREQYTAEQQFEILRGGAREPENDPDVLAHFGVKRAYELVDRCLDECRREVGNFKRLSEEVKRLKKEYKVTCGAYVQEHNELQDCRDHAKSAWEAEGLSDEVECLAEDCNDEMSALSERIDGLKALHDSANKFTLNCCEQRIRDITDVLAVLDKLYDAREPIPDLFDTFAVEACGNDATSVTFAKYLETSETKREAFKALCLAHAPRFNRD